MKLTIIREDGAVYKDGMSYSNLDLSFIPSDVHALQFNDVSNAGWIEFAQDDFGNKAANQIITSLPEWATAAINKWNEVKAEEEAFFAAEQARLAVNQPTTTGTQAA